MLEGSALRPELETQCLPLRKAEHGENTPPEMNSIFMLAPADISPATRVLCKVSPLVMALSVEVTWTGPTLLIWLHQRCVWGLF